MASLGKTFQKIPFDGHIECYVSIDELPQSKTIPGMHVGKDRLYCDRDNYPIIYTDMIKEGEVMRTMHGLGKCYGSKPFKNVVYLYADW